MQSRKFLNLQINENQVRLQLNTASDIISRKLWKSLSRPELEAVSLFTISAWGDPVKLTGKLNCGMAYRDTSISTAPYIVDTQLNRFCLDWLGQLGLWELSINATCNRAHSATSTTSFTAEMVVQHFPVVFQVGLGLCNYTGTTLKLISNAQPVLRAEKNLNVWNKEVF
ncbi:unnamed protein product [Hymenolepis diminuta]|uniref:DUF2163 domain-containing protein n=1 Tax=Hymenolepis diminuta TaxID=6216 RepID=A0A0R3SWZ1_HYMDI|nr:unnamed protein product [Hymenolepis diminuta]